MTPHILFASQKVKDIKVPANGLLERKMGKFRSWLHRHSFIPGEKVPATVTPVGIEDGVLVADISGTVLGSDRDPDVRLTQRFPLSLVGYNGPLEVEAIFSSVKDCHISDGGNVQNMIVNTALAITYAKQHPAFQKRCVRLSAASSSDPFARLPTNLATELRQVCEWYELDIPDRLAIQVPWEDDDRSGILGITSEPTRTNRALEKLIQENPAFSKAFREATCFVSADPIYEQLATSGRPPYQVVINASTAFRSLVATESYNRCVILPMNSGEAGDVCKIVLQRALEEELERIKRPPFPAPLTPCGDDVDWDALKELDKSLDMYTTYIPIGRERFACPISFGSEGGLLISTGEENFACFSSTPSERGEDELLKEFGEPAKIVWDRIDDVGAGDGVASIITLFNCIGPETLLIEHMQGRERLDRSLLQLASMIFVSVLARIGGNFLVRTQGTCLLGLRHDAFTRMLDEAAQGSLDVARSLVKKLHAPATAEVKRWGIRVVVWQPRTVAFPERMLGEEAEQVPTL